MKTAAPEKKSVKTLKGQLFGAVSMMLVAAIALGTSTYAWFINNRTVNVDDMTIEVSTSTSMLVAIQKKDASYTGYKSLITNDDITGLNTPNDAANWSEFFKQKMVPSSVTTTSLITTTPDFYMTNNHVSNGLLDEFVPVPKADATVGDVTTYGIGQGPVKKLGLRFVGSNDLDVYFGKDGTLIQTIADLITPKLTKTQAEVDAMPTGNADQIAAHDKAAALLLAETKQAEAIRAALRVSIVAKPTGADSAGAALSGDPYGTAAEVHTFQFDLGEPYATGNKNNTKYKGATATTAINEKEGTYAAIATVDGSNHISTDAVLSVMVPADSPDKTNNANNTLATVTSDGDVTAPGADGIKLFQLKKDLARDVDVYIWLEGTDQDCLNSISGFFYKLKLPFAATLTPTP